MTPQCPHCGEWPDAPERRDQWFLGTPFTPRDAASRRADENVVADWFLHWRGYVTTLNSDYLDLMARIDAALARAVAEKDAELIRKTYECEQAWAANTKTGKLAKAMLERAVEAERRLHAFYPEGVGSEHAVCRACTDILRAGAPAATEEDKA
jgi:hypothetical protein